MKKLVRDNILYSVDKYGNEEAVCENILTNEVRINLLTGDNTLRLQLWPRGEPLEKDIPRSELNRSLIPKLQGYGISLISDMATEEFIVERIFETEQKAPVQYFHTKLGYVTMNDGTPIYLLHNPIGFPPESDRSKSVYYQSEKTTPKGTLDSWLDFVKRCVVGRGNMELALSLGACGPVFYTLKKCGEITDMPIIMLISKSSCGKTLSLRVMASLFGSPEENAGLIHNFNCTENAFYAQMESSKGMTILFDEVTSQSNSWDFSKLLYTLPTGCSKRRCRATGELDSEKTFFSPLIITGERSVLATADKDMNGLHARVFELRCTWTESAKHAHELEKGVRQSYGVAGTNLIQWILENEVEIVKTYNEIFEDLTEESCLDMNQYAGILDRKRKVAAGILTSAKVLMRVFSLNFDLEKMKEILCSAYKEQLPEQTMEDAAYEAIVTLYAQNPYKFPKKKKHGMYCSQSDYQVTGIWGERDDDKLWIIEEKVQEVMREKGFGDLSSLKKSWYEAGLVKRDSQRHYGVPHKLNGVSQKCMCFMITEEPKSTAFNNQSESKRKLDKNNYKRLIEETEE